MSLQSRFESKFNKGLHGECWNWNASLWTGGYGQIGEGGRGSRNLGAHRVSYELYKGKIQNDLVVDHICRNRKCVNPDHLRLLTRGENVMCGETIPAKNLAKTHCINGHEFTIENTYTYKNTRQCVKCRKIHDGKRIRK